MVDHVVHVLPPFLLACLVLAALPGPATALFLHRTLRDGRRAGIAAVAGNEIGVFCWVVSGGAGLSVLLSANRILFDALHVIGGSVLVILGVQAWRTSRERSGDGHRDGDGVGVGVPMTTGVTRGRSPGSAFRASLISIAANPKAAVFGVSFFPQFLPRHGPLIPTVLVLATIQIALDTAWCTGIVLLAGRARGWLSHGAVRRRIERGLGTILIALGIELAVDTR